MCDDRQIGAYERRFEWFELDEARRRLKAAQVPFLDRLQAALASTTPEGLRFVLRSQTIG